MLWPRASDMRKLRSPGQPGGPVDGPGPARAKTCRTDAANHDAGNLACAAAACTAFGAGRGIAFAASSRDSSSAIAVAAGAAGVSSAIPGTMYGFSHHSSPVAGRPGRAPFTLPPNATMARASSGQSGWPGPMPRRRHIQAIERPNGPRIDAASDCVEPAGRSGRSSCQYGSLERRNCAASMRLSKPWMNSAMRWTSHSGRRADASGPARSASGEQASA
jgi:hypothetical protein